MSGPGRVCRGPSLSWSCEILTGVTPGGGRLSHSGIEGLLRARPKQAEPRRWRHLLGPTPTTTVSELASKAAYATVNTA